MPSGMQTEGVRLLGLDKLNKKLSEIPDKMRRKGLKDVMKKSADVIKESAKSKCRKNPRGPTWPRTGHLADNIVDKISVTKKGSKAIVGIDYKRAHHGHLVEFGHQIVVHGKKLGRKTRSFPFMRPAFDQDGNKALDVMLDEAQKLVERSAR